MRQIATTFAIAGIGVAVFLALGLPLPWLLGPIFACLLAALSGRQLAGIKPLNASMRTILGVAVGATFTPALLASMAGMWPTLLLIPVMIIASGVIGVPYFRRIWQYDFATAYYSAMPGGLQDMLLFGQEAGGSVRTLSLVHATRVLVVVVALPFILHGLWQADLSQPPGASVTTIAPGQLALMVLCAGIGWWGATRVGLFGASILGPMIVAAAAALLGLLQHRPPAEAIWAAQFFIGMGVGTQYTGITLVELRRDVVAALGYCGILFVLTLILVEIVYNFGLAPGMEALLAFAPGGQAEMTVLALIVGADMAFVIAHHLLRIVTVILGAPIFARYFK